MSIRPYQVNGQSFYEVYVHDLNVHGKRMQKRKRGLQTLKAARDLESKFKAEIYLEKGKPQRLTWDLWFKRFLEQIRLTRRPKTVINYETNIAKWVSKHWDNLYLDEITPQLVFRLVLENTEGLSLNSKRALLDQIKRIFDEALINGIVQKNPTLSIRIKVPEVKQAVLNGTEAQRLLLESKLTQHRFYPVWAFALFTGMRSGELFALKWSDIDFESRRISVNKAWSNKSGIGPTKSQRNRVVPVSDELLKLLHELRATFKDPEEHVLPRIQEWTDGSQADVLRQFCKAIGITSVKFHDLRATFITQMLLRGVPLAQVMSIVGHSELHTTTRYLRVAGADLDGATNSLSYSLPTLELAKVISFAPSPS